jgi:hypothetical protein
MPFARSTPQMTASKTAAISLFFLLGACADLVNIQETAPIRTAKFTGSHQAVAQCIHDRIGGKVTGAEFGEAGDRLIVYDSVKFLSHLGMSHYSFTILKTGLNQGIVEWRIINQQLAPMADETVQRFWIPAQECAQPAKRSG